MTNRPDRGAPFVGAGAQRRARLVSLLVGGANEAFGTKRLCQICAEVTATSGASITLMGNGSPITSLCTTNLMSERIEQLQYDLDEGPGIDAYRQDRPVIEPDLGGQRAPRWLAFSPAAIEAGARAVFGFPLRVGAVRLGALNLYRDQPGPLNDDEHADALVMADIAAEAALVLQASAARGQDRARAQGAPRSAGCAPVPRSGRHARRDAVGLDGAGDASPHARLWVPSA